MSESTRKAVSATLNVRGGTPGSRSVDGRSHPADATGLVVEMAKMHGIDESEAAAFVRQAKSDVGDMIKHGWDPRTVAHLLCFELALAAHHSQTGWQGLREFLNEHLGPYYDAAGRWMEHDGQTHEDRDATEGMVVPAMH